MNFEDEPYVRLYTRRSVTNRRLGWEGRAVMHEMLYEFDKAGIFELNGEAAESIELVTGLPPKVIKPGLAKLLKLSVWEVRGEHLIWPRFLEAQTARRSDKQRQNESRARRRDGVTVTTMTDRDAGVTPRDGRSRPVTAGHEESQAVTKCHSGLSSALPGSAPLCSADSDPPHGVRGRDRFGDSFETEHPGTIEPTDTHRELCRARGLDLENELGKHRSWAQSRKRLCLDWSADFELWIRGSKRQASAGAAPVPPSSPETQARLKAERDAAEAAVTARRRREVAERAGPGTLTVDEVKAAMAAPEAAQ